MTEVISPKKLIEVAMPLDAINEASAREKSIRHGHPSTLHLWWARRPLAAARAVIYAQFVHDPEDLWRCQNPGKAPSPQNRSAWTKARARHFKIIEDLVQWENTTNEVVLDAAREAIREAWRQTCELNAGHPRAAELFDPAEVPAFHDPFAGGGALPLEAQRLGFESHASDLNPVAVLINKAMIEIPPRFAGLAPVNPVARTEKTLIAREWKGAQGLAEDVRHYGQWMRDEAEKRIGALYPKVAVTAEMAQERPDLKPYVGQELTVIAWLWARTVKSPNPAFASVEVPLASTFLLSTKAGKEAYVEPVIESGGYRFTVKAGKPQEAEKAKRGTKSGGSHSPFLCLMSGAPMSFEFLRGESKAGRMGSRLMAIVAEGTRGRVYLPPTPEHEAVAKRANKPEWKPAVEICHWPGRTNVVEYGLTTFGDLFTPRQLAVLTTFSDLVGEAMQQVRVDALGASLPDDSRPLREGGAGVTAYAEAVGVYLAFALDKVMDRGSSIGRWDPTPTQSGIINTFSRQAIPMTWDFAESNPLGAASGNLVSAAELVAKAIGGLPASLDGVVSQADANSQSLSSNRLVSADPPYYDNIGYADLSDFFYVWLRRSLREVFPELFVTVAVPKAEELVATPHRHGSKEEAETFFLDGMTQAMHRLAEQAHPAFPVTIYYAFKQSETEGAEGTTSTGWETFLDAVIRAGFGISGTWPMRTELSNRMIGAGANALASSIVLVCRQRAATAPTATRREFVRVLNQTLPEALNQMTTTESGDHSPVAPVDLSQAIIGPGMAVFSQYSAVLEADGTPMTVRTALQLINRFLAEADFDPDTQFCLAWFDQHGWQAGPYGDAETLAKAKGTSVGGVHGAGVLESGQGRVRLLRWKEYAEDWKPGLDARLPVWEALHQLVGAYERGGDAAASAVLAAIGTRAEGARQLAYRLYALCERKGWAEDARAYNQVVGGWGAIEEEAARIPGPRQDALFGIEEGSA